MIFVNSIFALTLSAVRLHIQADIGRYSARHYAQNADMVQMIGDNKFPRRRAAGYLARTPHCSKQG